MIKLFEKTETDKYIIIKILFIKITFKKKSQKSYIDTIVWWVPNRKLRDFIRKIYYKIENNDKSVKDINNRILNEILTSNNKILEHINFQLNRITPKANINIIEMHLSEHCNLNCQCCSHFSQLAEPEFANIEIFERDIKRLSELSNGEVNIIHLMGGEPLLNPNCEKFFELARKYFDKTEIKLVTNGILLLKQKDSFWQSMKNNNITLAPTKYPIKVDWDKIKEICKNMDIKLKFFNNENVIKTSFYNPLNLDGNENPILNFRNCFLANNCLILENGKLYTCSYIPNIRHFNKFFNKNIPISVNDYIDIHKARDYQEVLQFLAKPIPFCKYCDVKNRKDGIAWKTSTKSIEEYIK